MTSYTVTSHLSPGEVVKRARAFFGHSGLDLKLSVSSERCLRFGDGGYVQLRVRDGSCETIVELETHLWDEQVREFISTLTGSIKKRGVGG